MGISQLNSFLNKNCSEHIHNLSLSKLRNKKMVIDVQIYLYSFLCSNNGSLMQNLYLMCSLFIKYEIVPLFVFDGRQMVPNNIPTNKTDKQKQRKDNRNHIINTILLNSDPDKIISNAKFQTLCRQLVRVSNAQISKAKQVIHSFGFTCFDATEEADEICAHVSMSNPECACLSEDSDMFAYGCTQIYRNLNLECETISYVNVSAILTQLEMSAEELRTICVLSKNDYNCNRDNVPNIFKLMEHFKEFKQLTKNTYPNKDFYEWLSLSTKNIHQINETTESNANTNTSNQIIFKKIYNIFDVCSKPISLPKIYFANSQIKHETLKNIMESEGFHYL